MHLAPALPLITVVRDPLVGSASVVRRVLVYMIFVVGWRAEDVEVAPHHVAVQHVDQAWSTSGLGVHVQTDGRTIEPVYLAPGCEPLDFEEVDGYARIALPPVGVHAVIVVEKSGPGHAKQRLDRRRRPTSLTVGRTRNALHYSVHCLCISGVVLGIVYA